MADRGMGLKEAAEYLGLSPKTLSNWLSKDKFKIRSIRTKMGTKNVFYESKLKRFKEERTGAE